MEKSIENLWRKAKQVYDYDPSGELRLKSNGMIVSTPQSRGYRQVYLEARQYLLHRLIFFWHHGYLPKVVDHIDGDKTNNKIENLQGCDQHINISKAKIFSTNTTGFKGVSYNKSAKKYESYFWKNYQKIHCGLWNTAEEAFKAREEKRYGRMDTFPASQANNGTD